MYFKNFPLSRFLISPPGYKKKPVYVNIVDITTNIRFIKQLIDNISLYEYYIIQDGETLEIISEKLYGSPHYNWILMLLNNIYDYRKDYIMSEISFERYITEKYGSISNAQNTIYGYRNKDGIWSTQYSFDPKNNKQITNTDFRPVYTYEYEIEQNEKKRKLKIVSEDIIAVILDNFRTAI